MIGLGHGRMLSAAVDQMPHFEAKGVDFVSLLGGLTRNYAANPHDVMHSLAHKTGSNAYVLPVPFFANSESDRAILLAQPGVREIFDLSSRATLKLVGMGTVTKGAQLVASGMIEPHEIAEIHAGGAVAEMMGHFFDKSGCILETTLSARTLSVDLSGTGNEGIVVIAGGTEKAQAIRAVLNSGRLTGLITDEATARKLVD